ncbi:sprouty-related, EVH1 domain-containing protein 1 isoform X2 [Bactrocera neohumeralis]|uniref:sprouty-related, EVH1 domain-containing protein 1 isoform X2 n=1 Tax=Bactrocera tryoni TaxID=59916 RepID=UPI001A96638D|nr:sprouty-related, EVH1 domain-containing protein 1 isoform X2 [Bactrocera tryoni]XP_050324169.1 sprouty-related, EVH1 domain-containing protein 1 isoform X2 [Bactrocera neohumeralis]
MTEGHESDFLVTVRAQVMTRDESTEGWLPLAGGGLANVSIRKRARLSPGAAGHEYIIYGQRISDQSVILSCVINRDLKYYKVMPTFHHWRAGKQRNGLTFQTAADARAFDKGVLRAYNELIDGLAKSNPSIICPPLTKYDSVGEDDVFMTLDLPIEAECIQKSHSSPEGSEKSHKSISVDRGERISNKSDLDRSSDGTVTQHPKATIHYISNEKSCSLQAPPPPPSLSAINVSTGAHNNSNVTTNVSVAIVSPPITTVSSSQLEAPPPSLPTAIATSENYSYVQLTVHDYNYPVVDQPAGAQVLNARRESISALKKRNALEAAQALAAAQSSPIAAGVILKDPTSNVDIIKKSQRARCRYCHELYNDEWNRKGACEFAPDRFRSAFEYISGMGCARCMLYHCMSDAEGETPQHPCQCVNEAGCTKRWLGLTLLSLLVPCLWCYPPLRACHWLGVSCGVCGGRHKPQV